MPDKNKILEISYFGSMVLCVNGKYGGMVIMKARKFPVEIVPTQIRVDGISKSDWIVLSQSDSWDIFTSMISGSLRQGDLKNPMINLVRLLFSIILRFFKQRSLDNSEIKLICIGAPISEAKKLGILKEV